MSAAQATGRFICLQPAEGPDRRLPYPFFIYEGGRVGRQDVWKGDPLLLVGFSDRQDAGSIDVTFEEFWADPSAGQGRYAVFEDADGQMGTHIGVIAQVRDNAGEQA